MRGSLAVVVLFSLCAPWPSAVPLAVSQVFESSGPASNIIDFSPTSFPVKADAKFFYAIDKELKYSDHIDPQAPTLLRGSIKSFLVSPDANRIAVVVNGRLLIVGANAVLGEVANVDTIYRSHKPIGRQFFRNQDFQWSCDSKSIYLIRDEYYRSKGSQLFSLKGELWKFDVETGNLALILKPFAAHSYFFDQDSAIYYSEPTGGGDLQLKIFNGRASMNVDAYPPGGKNEVPFYSFASSMLDNAKAQAWLNVRLDHRDGLESVVINERKYLTVTQGKGWEGSYYCTRHLDGVFLPGDRYFMLDLPDCSNYRGQLLLEIESGRYQTLPRNTVVFRTMNTTTFSHYRVTSSGMEILQHISDPQIKQAALKDIEVSSPFVVREVKGVVLTTDGQPLPGAMVSVSGSDGASEVMDTGDNGTFDFGKTGSRNPIAWLSARMLRFKSGTYRFKVTKNEFHPAVGTVVISPDAPKDSSITVYLQSGDVGAGTR
jgi:hypothetical protein